MTGAHRLAPLVLFVAVAPAVVISSVLLAGRVPAGDQFQVAAGQIHPESGIVVRLRPVSLPMPAPPAPRVHVVVAGDTPWDVARASGVDVTSLLAANHLVAGSLLRLGQVLVLPPSSRPGAGVAQPAAAPRQPVTHTVASGDTLWDIAASAGVSVAELAAANHLSERATLRIGQVLMVPAGGSATGEPGADRALRAFRPGSPPEGGSPTGAPVRPAALLPLRWPASGTITSRFGWRIHPIFRTREFHTGLDIATGWGSPVVAARNGVVRFAGWQAGYGQMIVLDHGDGLETTYSHLSRVLVTPGEQVTGGQFIGRIGNTGWSTGPHLFFEVRRNGVAVDPGRYLK